MSYGRGIEGFVTVCLTIMAIGAICFAYLVYDFFSDDVYEVNKPITPEIKLVVEDNVIDTLYVYKFEN